MQTSTFRYRAVEWLREDLELNTIWLPQNRIEDDEGHARIEGSVVDAPHAPRLLTVSLWATAMAAVFAMAAQRPMDAASRQGLLTVAALGAALFVITLATAIVMRRRGTTAVVAHLRGSGRVDAATIERLHADSAGRACWCLASDGFDDDALAEARRLAIQCFAPDGDGFVAVTPRPRELRAA